MRARKLDGKYLNFDPTGLERVGCACQCWFNTLIEPDSTTWKKLLFIYLGRT